MPEPTGNAFFDKNLAEAYQGSGKAAYYVSSLYLIGQPNVPKDLVEAWAWGSLIRTLDRDGNATHHSDDFESELTPEQLLEARERAAELREIIKGGK